MLDENQVIDIVCGYLKSRGFDITQRLNTTQPGVDVIALNRSTGNTIFVEAKGGTSSRVGSRRYGKPYKPSQVFDRVAKGFYTAVHTSMSLAKTERSVLAVPDMPLFKKYIGRVAQPAMELGLIIYIVSAKHGVVELGE